MQPSIQLEKWIGLYCEIMQVYIKWCKIDESLQKKRNSICAKGLFHNIVILTIYAF